MSNVVASNADDTPDFIRRDNAVRPWCDPRTFYGKIYGQEKNLTTAAIARMNLVLHGIEDFRIVREGTLRDPAFTDSGTGGLATFACCSPPFLPSSPCPGGRIAWRRGFSRPMPRGWRSPLC
jgi:hypothetical protein